MAKPLVVPVPNTTGKRGKAVAKRKPHGVTYRECFLSEENRKVVLRAAELGLRDQTAAELIRMTPRQFFSLLEEDEEFASEYRQARRQGDFLIANTLVEVAVQDRDVRALVFLAKTRLGWQDAGSRIEIAGPEGGVIRHEHVAIDPGSTAEEAAEEWARFRDAKPVEGK